MNTSLRANLLLLITAIIWGFSFVAQRQGMDHVGPFTFNGARFAIGAASLIPILFLRRINTNGSKQNPLFSTATIIGGLLLGAVLFIGASLQQTGMIYTTAGKGGFITGLYVIIVPMLGLFVKQKTEIGTWMGAILAVIGMYLLSATDNFSISKGDLLVLCSALFWAIHVQLVGRFCQKYDALILSFYQFIFCALFSWLSALVWEQIHFDNLQKALLPILYTGILSVGVAYTLQVVAQKNAHPSHSAIILSLESVFAVIGGYFFLSEIITGRGLLGCCLMLIGMLLSQLFTGRSIAQLQRRLRCFKKTWS